MGEYVQLDGEKVKLGVCEDLNYTNFKDYYIAVKGGRITPAPPRFADPESYLLVDSGYRFRFPFPDEDKLGIGYREDFDRSVKIRVGSDFSKAVGFENVPPIDYLSIYQQKLTVATDNNELIMATVIRVPDGRLFSITTEADMMHIMENIVDHHIFNEDDPFRKDFYKKIANRMYCGYKLPKENHLKRIPRSPGADDQRQGLSIR